MKSAVKGPFSPISDFAIEAYLCGDLDGASRELLDERLRTDPRLRRYVEERRAAQRAFPRLHPLSPRMPEAATPAAPSVPRPRMQRWMMAIPALSVAATVATAVIWQEGTGPAKMSPAHERGSAEGDRVRTKGHGLDVTLYVMRGEEVFQHGPHIALLPGDRVRLRLNDARGGYLTVLARETDGTTSVYYDELAVGPGTSLVPDSLVLDANFVRERWLVIVDEQRRSTGEHLRNFRRNAAPSARHRYIELSRDEP